MAFRTAERKQAKIRIGLAGPSGSGKTYSALKLARGLTDSWKKIFLIDTENHRGELYSHLGEYQYSSLEKPFAPERFIAEIHEAEKAGAEVIIIDSSSHEWEGPGGCLESNDLLAQTNFKGNTWAAWSVTTPRHQQFIEAIIASPCHIITTMRSKTDTIQTEDKKIKKVGMKEIQREGFEYDLTLSFNIDRENHFAVVGKDNTQIFKANAPILLDETHGIQIREWNLSGAAPKFYCKACELKFNKQTEITEAEVNATKHEYKIPMCGDCVTRAKERAAAFEKDHGEVTSEDIAAIDAKKPEGGSQPPVVNTPTEPAAPPRVKNIDLLKEYEPLVNGCMAKDELDALRDDLANDARVSPFAKKTIDRMLDERLKGINAGL